MKNWNRKSGNRGGGWRNRILLPVTALLLITSGSAQTQGGAWEIKTSMPSARSAVAVVVEGKIYVIGGISQSLDPLSTVEEYDPVTDTWISKAPMPAARFSHFAGVVDGKIYVFGGQNVAFGPSLSLVEMYDPATDTWTTKSDLPKDRSQATAAVVDGKIYIVGGQGGSGNLPLAAIEVYDPATDSWDITKADMPTPRVFPGASVVREKIYVIGGGVSGAGGAGLSAIEVYDVANDKWHTTLPQMPTPRVGLSASSMHGFIYAIGGISAFAAQAEFLATVEAFDPATGDWHTALAGMPTPRYAHASAVVDGKIFAIGGDVAGFSRTAIVEAYTPPVITSVEDNISIGPATFVLHQNYPNPFNPTTTIAFHLDRAEHVELAVYNMTGQKIKTLVTAQKPAGPHKVSWDGRDNFGRAVASGVYLYRLQAGSRIVETKKMIFMK